MSIRIVCYPKLKQQLALLRYDLTNSIQELGITTEIQQ